MPLLLQLRDTPLSVLLLCISAGVLLAICLRKVYLWSRLRHIPGPRLASWSSGWQVAGVLSGQYHEWLKEAVDEYGPLIRIGPNELLSVDPGIIRRMSGVRSGYTKGSFYDTARFVPDVDNIVSIRDEEKHKVLRAKLAPAFVARENGHHSFEPGLNRQLLNFIGLLERKYVSSPEETRLVDLSEKIQYFTLDAISDIVLSEPFGYLDKDVDLYNYNEINASSIRLLNIVSVLPWLAQLVHKWPIRFFVPREGDRVGFGRIMGSAQSIVKKRLAPGAVVLKDMMQAHIDSGMTEEELIQEIFVAIIAGSGTAAHVLQMALVSLITSPGAYNTLQREIDRASAVSTPITWAQTQALPYLQSVVRESLRLWHPFCALGSKRVPPGGDHVNGFWVPGGTDISQGYHALGRSEGLWGDDAHVFRPERWLCVDGDELKTMISALDTHFGSGKNACLGKPIALMELHKTLFELMKHFDFTIVNTEKPIKVAASVINLTSDFWVRIVRRD